ncbi:MAG: FAD-dependent oxidoreductase, partial [Planctomycetota bacterium]|nr:FAD-dependent oxidoreductase [Planctomycetota bacterium]
MTRRRHISLTIVVTSVALLAYHALSPPHATIEAGNESVKPTRVDNDTTPDSPPNVIIVGAGISGLSAALELGSGGASVTVVDMSSVFGGHAVMSQGGVSVVDTPVQRETGWQDSVELAERDFIEWGEDADPEWVKYYVQNSRRDIYEWLT